MVMSLWPRFLAHPVGLIEIGNDITSNSDDSL